MNVRAPRTGQPCLGRKSTGSTVANNRRGQTGGKKRLWLGSQARKREDASRAGIILKPGDSGEGACCRQPAQTTREGQPRQGSPGRDLQFPLKKKVKKPKKLLVLPPQFYFWVWFRKNAENRLKFGWFAYGRLSRRGDASAAPLPHQGGQPSRISQKPAPDGSSGGVGHEEGPWWRVS